VKTNNFKKMKCSKFEGELDLNEIHEEFKLCFPFSSHIQFSHDSDVFHHYVHGYTNALAKTNKKIKNQDTRIAELEKELFRKHYDD
jgi:hypothetical protein